MGLVYASHCLSTAAMIAKNSAQTFVLYVCVTILTVTYSFTRPASLQRHCNQKHDGLGIASPASTADASMESIQSTSGLGSDTASISSEASSTPAFTQAKDSATEAGIPPMDMAYGLGASMHTGSQVDMNVGSQQAAYLDGSYESEMDMGSGYRNQAFSGPSGTHICQSML